MMKWIPSRTGVRNAAPALCAAAIAVFGFVSSHAQSDLVKFYGPIARVITPNGDTINDRAVFCFENPQDSELTGKIYTVLGTEVASTTPKADRTATAGAGCPGSIIRAQFSTWDGTAGGVRVRSGLYVYRFTAEQQVFSGTVFVFR